MGNMIKFVRFATILQLICYMDIASTEEFSVRPKRGAGAYKAGTKYWFNIEANNICGAGEGTSPDLYFEVFLRSGNKDWEQITRTRTKKKTSSGEWEMAFNVNYSPTKEQFVYIKVWDEDPVKNDYFGHISEFSIFKDQQRNKEHKIIPDGHFMKELGTCDRKIKSQRKNYPFINVKLAKP